MESKLAEKLSALRVRAGLSQRDVAKRIGISTQSCSHYETGRRTPDIFILYRFSQLYQVTMECLLTNRKNSSDYLFYKISNLPVEDRQNVEHFISFLHSRHPVSSQNSKHNK